MHRRPSANTQQRTGVILIVVLVLVVMISLAGFAFMKRMATEYEATVIGGELRQAVQTLASAETFLVALAEEQAPCLVRAEAARRRGEGADGGGPRSGPRRRPSSG